MSNDPAMKARIQALYENGVPISECPQALELFEGFDECAKPKVSYTWHDNWDRGTLRTFSECTTSSVAGIPRNGVSVMDIDDRASADIILEIVLRLEDEGMPPEMVIYNTTRGIHIVYGDAMSGTRDQSNKRVSILGIGCAFNEKTRKLSGECDFRHGGTGEGYVVVKFDGKPREVIYHHPEWKIGEAPIWLKAHPPSFFTKVEGLPFIGMVHGDGRNEAIFHYYGHLRWNKFSEEDARYVCRLINEHVFGEAMEESRFLDATREPRKVGDGLSVGNSESSGGGKKGSTNLSIGAGTTASEVADSRSDTEKKLKPWQKAMLFLFETRTFANIDRACYMYIEGKGVYQLITADVVEDLILHSFAKDEMIFTDNELRSATRALCGRIRNFSPTRTKAVGVIPFADGDYLLENKEFLEFSPERVVMARLPHAKPTCTEAPEFCWDTLMAWGDGDFEVAKLLVQIIAFCLIGQLDSIQQCVLLLGDKQNGKTKYIDLLKLIVGAGNYSSLTMSNLSDKFKTADLAGKMLNASDETKPGYIEDLTIFKQLTGQGELTVEEKGCKPIKILYQGAMVFASNDMPRVKDDTGAVLRRFCLVPFTHVFEKNDWFTRELKKPENIEGFIYLALKEAHALYNEGKGLDKPKRCEALYGEYDELNNPLGVWAELVDVDAEIIDKKPDEVFDNYASTTRRYGGQPKGSKEFWNLLKKVFEVQTVVMADGLKSVRVYKRIPKK